jgi:hypothetical protein
MKIFIKYENTKISLITINYESIASIINKFIKNDNINNYFMDYNGLYLNNNFSLEKYNIKTNSILNLNKKKRGGNSFFNFVKKNPVTIAVCLIIALLPIFILPMGYVPSIASFITLIIKKSVNTLGKYLVCTLGKSTLFSRLSLLIEINKYIIFILMIFVIITFPLIVLCITMKGHLISDDPKNMCSAINSGNTAGMILTSIYVVIYTIFRGGNFIFNPIINFCKQFYILNVLFVPILKAIVSIYNTSKYIGVFLIPFIGQALQPYFLFLGTAISSLQIILSTITELGCKTEFSKESFTKLIMKKISGKKKEEKEEELPISFNKEFFCKEDNIKCCSPNNYINIADALTYLTENPLSSSILKSSGLYPSFTMFIEAFYESALVRLNSNVDLSDLAFNEKKMYLHKFLEEQMDKISSNGKKIIEEFLNNGNESLIDDIKKYIPESSSPQIIDIKAKLALLENNMIEYSIQDHSKYVPGKSLFKTIFKIIFVDIFCNISSTSKSSTEIIREMGDAIELVDMLKAGTSTGVFLSIIYFITVIVLIICGIFNVY